MPYLLIGLNHRTAPLDIREKFAFSPEKLPAAFGALRGQPGLDEAMILSTCNRVELVAHSENPQLAQQSLREFLSGFHHIAPAILDPHLYALEHRDVIRHVFRVASSLDSLVVGEPQILGQMKAAYSQAHEAGALGSYLSGLMHRAFFVAKKVRSQTDIASSSVSISHVAVELARKIFGQLDGKSALILGAGKMGDLAVRQLITAGISKVFVSSRNRDRAVEVAAGYRAQPIPFENAIETLAHCDIVIVSTGAPHYLLSVDDARRVIRERRNRPIFIIDISVPRNVDPRVNQVENVFLYDIDDLQSVADANFRERHREGILAEQLIDREVALYQERLKSSQQVPLILSVREKVDEICQTELARAVKKMEPLSPADMLRLEEMARRIAGKISHPLTQAVKNEGAPDEQLNFPSLLGLKLDDDA
jgi:glutamyl-tRNA reductase